MSFSATITCAELETGEKPCPHLEPVPEAGFDEKIHAVRFLPDRWN